MSIYVTPKAARQKLSVFSNSFEDWDAKGIIKTVQTPGEKRLYDISSFVSEESQDSSEEKRTQICY